MRKTKSIVLVILLALAIIPNAIPVIPTASAATAHEPGYEYNEYNAVTVPTIDGKWTNTTEWTDAPTLTISPNAFFMHKLAEVNFALYTAVQYNLIEFRTDTTNDTGDRWQICMDSLGDGGSAPHADDYKFEIEGHTTLKVYQGNGTDWAPIATPAGITWNNSISASPLQSTPHWILEFRLDKGIGPIKTLPPLNIRVAVYDASNAPAGWQAWPPESISKDNPSRWGQITQYTQTIFPQGGGAGYTETNGTLDGAQFAVRVPNSWNGMLVVICRGWSGTPVTDIWSNIGDSANVSLLIDRGFAVAGSTYGATGFCIQKGVNSTYQLTNYVINTYHVTGKVFLYGISMGGAVALLLAEKYPKLYSGVLDMFGLKDLKEQQTRQTRWQNQSDVDLTAELTALTVPIPMYIGTGLYSLQGLRNVLALSVPGYAVETGGTPASNPKAYEDDSPTYHANITIPVITVQGTSDVLVPFYETLMYKTAVANAGRSNLYRLYNVTGGQHNSPDVLAQAPARFAELVSWSEQLRPSLRVSAFSNVTVLSGWNWYFFAHSNGGIGVRNYQWYENTTLLQGQTSMVLQATKNTPGVYAYYCKVTDSEGVTTYSNPVALTVLG